MRATCATITVRDTQHAAMTAAHKQLAVEFEPVQFIPSLTGFLHTVSTPYIVPLYQVSGVYTVCCCCFCAMTTEKVARGLLLLLSSSIL